MGRAQVLYNRKKGRNTNRSGRGGGRGNDRDGPDRDFNDTNIRRKKTHTPLSQQPLPSGSLEDGIYSSNQKDYEQEYEVMFAGRDTYLSSHGVPAIDDAEEEEPSSFLSGRICIASMAATFESISIEKRMKLPYRVAATAFPSRFQGSDDHSESKDDDETSERKENTNTTASSAAVTTEDKDNSEDAESDSNMEDWLDGMCDTDDKNAHDLSKVQLNPGQTRDTTTKAAIETQPSTDAVSNTPSFSKENERLTTNTTNDALTKVAEDFGEDNLDDWLDSVI